MAKLSANYGNVWTPNTGVYTNTSVSDAFKIWKDSAFGYIKNCPSFILSGKDKTTVYLFDSVLQDFLNFWIVVLSLCNLTSML